MKIVDSKLIIDHCPSCQTKNPNFELIFNKTFIDSFGNSKSTWSFFICDRCLHPVMIQNELNDPSKILSIIDKDIDDSDSKDEYDSEKFLEYEEEEFFEEDTYETKENNITETQLLKIIGIHNNWLKSNGKIGNRCRLDSIICRNIRLKGINLSQADFTNVDFSFNYSGKINDFDGKKFLSVLKIPHSVFEGCDFHKSIFNNVSFMGAEFKNCNFNECEFRDVDLRHTHFENCKFHKADLIQLDISMSTFYDVSFIFAKLVDIAGCTPFFSDHGAKSYNTVDFTRCNFTDVSFTLGNFSLCYITNSIFEKVKCWDTDFDTAQFDNCAIDEEFKKFLQWKAPSATIYKRDIGE